MCAAEVESMRLATEAAISILRFNDMAYCSQCSSMLRKFTVLSAPPSIWEAFDPLHSYLNFSSRIDDSEAANQIELNTRLSTMTKLLDIIKQLVIKFSKQDTSSNRQQ